MAAMATILFLEIIFTCRAAAAIEVKSADDEISSEAGIDNNNNIKDHNLLLQHLRCDHHNHHLHDNEDLFRHLKDVHHNHHHHRHRRPQHHHNHHPHHYHHHQYDHLYQTTHPVWENPCNEEELTLSEEMMVALLEMGDQAFDEKQLVQILLRAMERLKNFYRRVLKKFVRLRLEESIPDESYNLGGFYNNMSHAFNMTSSIDNGTSFNDWLSAAYETLRVIESLTLETVKDEERTFNEPLTFTSDYIRLLDDPEGGIRYVLCVIYSSPDLYINPGLDLVNFELTPVPSNTIRHDRDYCFLRDSYDVISHLANILKIENEEKDI